MSGKTLIDVMYNFIETPEICLSNKKLVSLLSLFISMNTVDYKIIITTIEKNFFEEQIENNDKITAYNNLNDFLIQE